MQSSLCRVTKEKKEEVKIQETNSKRRPPLLKRICCDLPLSPLFQSLLFIILLCAPTNLTGVVCVFSLPHAAYTSIHTHTHTMQSLRSEAAPQRFTTSNCSHSLTRDNSSVSGLTFSYLQLFFFCVCVFYRMREGEGNLFFFFLVPHCASYGWLRSHQSRSHGSIYLRRACHVYEFEICLSLQRG